MKKVIASLLLIIFFSINIFAAFGEEAHKKNENIFYEFKKNDKKKNATRKISTIDFNIEDVQDRRVIIKLKESESIDLGKLDCEYINTSKILKKRNIIIGKIPENIDFKKKIKEISSHASVEYVEPDYIIEKDSLTNVSFLENEWYMKATRAKETWNNLGNTEVIVAVLDTGIDYNHPDLMQRVLEGKDFVHQDSDPMDDHGHGTHVSGIIATIAPHAKILPIKILNEKGKGSIAQEIEGLYYAIDHEADIINMSYGDYTKDFYSVLEQEALQEAYHHNIVLVAASGNDGVSRDFYPASCDHVISVGATDGKDKIGYFSNYGNWLDIAAPGVKIKSTVPRDIEKDTIKDGYGISSGTSMAAPMVSGAVAIIKSIYPDYNSDKIEWLLEKSADKVHEEDWDEYYGYGRLNIFNALNTPLIDLREDAKETIEDAKEIKLNTPVLEKMDIPNDNDLFMFEIKEKSKINISLRNVPSNLDLIGFLQDEQGNYIKEIDEGSMGKEEEIDVELEPGKYYMGIYDFYNHWSDKRYTLEIINENLKMEVNIENHIELDVKLGEEERIKSLEILDEDIVLGYTENIIDNKGIITYDNLLDKPSYKLRITSTKNKAVVKEIQVKSTLQIMEQNSMNKSIKIKALVNGNLYKNDTFVKSVEKEEEILLEHIEDKDTFKIEE